ncbi:MAG: cation-efflux pump [Anaerolineae bacterium]|nr:cation-efflux pump [Anaerolineae bacterium]MCO5195715.1 cation-efflux pump [Anaerolineae bacterium]
MRLSVSAEICYPDGMNRDHNAIRRALIVSLFVNLLAMVIKLGVGFATGALSLIADGLDTLFDAAANIVGLYAVRIGALPPDDDHPYGHRKFETVAALLIAAFLFIAAWEVATGAIQRLLNPADVVVNGWVIAAVVVSGGMQGIVGVWEIRRGRALQSEILVADGRHAFTSLFVSAGVLVGLLAVAAGLWWADSIVALAIAGLIAKIGVDTIRENIPALVDEAPLDSVAIGRIVGDVHGVESYHRIRSRGTADHIAIDLHVRVAPNLAMPAANAIGDEVRRRLLALPHVDDVTVHIEAERGPESATDTYEAVKLCAAEVGVTIHEFWVQSVDDDRSLHLHVGVAPDLTLSEAHALVDDLEQRIMERRPRISAVHTHIELATVDVLPSAGVSSHLQKRIERGIMEAIRPIPGIYEPHDIVVRQVEGQLFINLEAFVDGNLYVADAHERSTTFEKAIREAVPNVGEVIIHLEPGAEEPVDQELR